MSFGKTGVDPWPPRPGDRYHSAVRRAVAVRAGPRPAKGRPVNRNAVAIVLLPLLLALGGTGGVRAQSAEPLPPNPFSIFETITLANGLRVWYGHMPGATLTSMAVLIPYGRDHDPAGREQTSHFLEHVLLSDRGGRTEAELVRELARRGGGFSGITGPHSTVFPLSIATEDAGFGVEWLHGVVAPRQFSRDLVERNREPVAVELGLRRPVVPRGRLTDWLRHPALRPPGFWRREFGYAAHEERGTDDRTGLAAVTAADLQAFFDTHYGPATMTLVIVTGRPRSELQPLLEETFGTLPWRPAPPAPAPLHVRQGESTRVQWRAGETARLAVRYRVAGLDGRNHLRLLFMEDLLQQRLMRRLRSGAAKAVYSVGTFTEVRGDAAFIGIVADMGPRQERVVRAAIDEELRRLQDAARDTTFYADRDALARAIRVEYAAPGTLRHWATTRLHRPDLHHDVPDLGEYYATVGPDSIGALAARLFVPDNRVLTLARPLPVHAGILAALALLVVWAAARLYRRAVLQPADMSAIRYIGRIRRPRVVMLAAAATGGAAAVVLLRLLAAAAHLLVEAVVVPTGSLALLAGGGAVVLFAATMGVLAGAGLLHAKVLVFDGEVRIKSPTYRATVFDAGAVRGARIVTSRDGLRLRRPSPGPVRSAAFLELTDGTGLLLRVRNPDRLVAAVSALVGRRKAVTKSPLPGHALPDEAPALVAAGAGDAGTADPVMPRDAP
jgi:zinc protease